MRTVCAGDHIWSVRQWLKIKKKIAKSPKKSAQHIRPHKPIVQAGTAAPLSFETVIIDTHASSPEKRKMTVSVCLLAAEQRSLPHMLQTEWLNLWSNNFSSSAQAHKILPPPFPLDRSYLAQIWFLWTLIDDKIYHTRERYFKLRRHLSASAVSTSHFLLASLSFLFEKHIRKQYLFLSEYDRIKVFFEFPYSSNSRRTDNGT